MDINSLRESGSHGVLRFFMDVNSLREICHLQSEYSGCPKIGVETVNDAPMIIGKAKSQYLIPTF